MSNILLNIIKNTRENKNRPGKLGTTQQCANHKTKTLEPAATPKLMRLSEWAQIYDVKTIKTYTYYRSRTQTIKTNVKQSNGRTDAHSADAKPFHQLGPMGPPYKNISKRCISIIR